MITGLVLRGGNACLGVRTPCKSVFFFHINQSVCSPHAGDGLLAEWGLALTLPTEISHQYKQGPCLHFLCLFPQSRAEQGLIGRQIAEQMRMSCFFPTTSLQPCLHQQRNNPRQGQAAAKVGGRLIVPASQRLRKGYSQNLSNSISGNLNNGELLNHRCPELHSLRILHSWNRGNTDATRHKDRTCPPRACISARLNFPHFFQWASVSLLPPAPTLFVWLVHAHHSCLS